MDSGGPPASELWLEIDITQVGMELAVAARGGLQMESAEPPPLSMEIASQFEAWVRRTAESQGSLSLSALAQQLQEAIFRPGIREVLHKLQGAAQGRPLLLKVNPRSPALKAIPWEALCLPGSASEFLGTSPEVLLARGVASTTAWQKREVQGAVRLLVISPEDPDAPGRLKSLLSESLASGELAWLEPLIGLKASKAGVENRLRLEPVPHILHFIGHGGLEGGSASLRMAAGSEQEPGYPVRLLADELRNLFRNELRLIVLESCRGAQPGELLSAAEELARGAAGAVIAHLWEVKADVARRCSAAFYRALTGRSEHAGDVARSLHAARRTLLNEFHGSAEAFSPLLYLRGRQPVLFDFSRRRAVPPRALPEALSADALDPTVGPLLELNQKPKRFDLFLSHHSVDKPWVLRLKSALDERGLTVWLDRDEIRPGDLFVRALERGLQESRAVALVASPESLRSGWVQEEYSRALALSHSADHRVQLIPVLLRDVELPGFLANRNWVDFRDDAVFEQSLDKLIWGATGKKPNTSSARPLKRRALLDRRLAAEFIVSYPPRAGSRRVDVRSQYSNLYALSTFHNVLVENHYGSVLAGLVSQDELLRETIIFLPGEASGEPADVPAAVAEASHAWLGDPGFQLAASMYGRSKGNLAESLPDAVAYLQRMLLLARRFDAAIIPHPDRWRLYQHWFENCLPPPAAAKRTRTLLSLPEPVAAAAEAISAHRAECVARIASGMPGPAPLVHLIRYGPMVYPFPAVSAKQQELSLLATLLAFTYEFCTAGSTEATR